MFSKERGDKKLISTKMINDRARIVRILNGGNIPYTTIDELNTDGDWEELYSAPTKKEKSLMEFYYCNAFLPALYFPGK